MIDLSKLPPPKLLEELDYQVILAAMRTDLAARLPEWTAAFLESDPANKILEVAAYREMLMRQRVNEAARALLVAYSTGSDLDHLAARNDVTRLPGAAATFPVHLGLSAALDRPVVIPAAFRLVSRDGDATARTLEAVTIPAGEISAQGLAEVVAPEGSNGNGLSLHWEAVNPLPFVVEAVQVAPASGGSDTEPDDDLRQRVALALERATVAGSRRSYEYWAFSADERVRDAVAMTPEPGAVRVILLSSDGDGHADAAMLERVTQAVSPDTVRPLTDRVEVVSASVVPYAVAAELVLYPGVAGGPPYQEALRRVRERVTALHRIGGDVPRSALIAALHAEGVKAVELASPIADLHLDGQQAAWCSDISVTSRVADEI